MSYPEAILDRWQVSRLSKHRLQNQYFGRRSEGELQELAEVIQRNGMHPIDIKPDGTILSGHQRWYIAKNLLKWEDVPVNIRHDLVLKGEEACDQYFLHANLVNREPSMLQKVRAFALDCQLEEQRRKMDKSLGRREQLGRVRDAVAKHFGKSGRTLADWLPILDLPPSVQQAVEDGRLSRRQAMEILAATVDVQAQIAGQLADHKTVAKVLKVLKSRSQAPPTAAKLTRSWRRLIRTVGELYRHRPGCFAAVLPAQRKGVDLLIEFAALAKAHFAAEIESRTKKKQTLKLVPRIVDGAPGTSGQFPKKQQKPRLVLRSKDSVA